MSNKLSIPSVTALSDEKLSFGATVFLQAVEDGLKILDDNAIYKDAITVTVPKPTIKAISAQGQGFSVSSVSVASGDDYAVLVSDVKALLQTVLQQQTTIENLTKQLQGA